MSSMMDAINGGQPPMGPGGPPPGGPPPGGGMPPDLMAMLGGQGGPPPGPPAPDPSQGEPAGDTADVIKQMIDLAKNYLDVEDDDQEKAQMAAVLKSLQDFLAREQKEAQDALGGKMSPRLLNKAYSG